MAPYGAHCRRDLGASEAIATQPNQAPSLGPSASKVEAAPLEARWLERTGAIFDAFRSAVAELCRKPVAVEDGDRSGHRVSACTDAGCLRMGGLALQPSALPGQRNRRSAFLDTQPAGQQGRACSTRTG